MASLPLPRSSASSVSARPAAHAATSARPSSEAARRLRSAVPPASARAATTEAPPPFTHLEAMAIQVGRSDPIFLPNAAGRLVKIARVLFGSKPANPLANGRLEALRVVVIAMRRGGSIPGRVIDAAIATGITPAQLDGLATELRGGRAL
jgi:hypothetical protein